MWRSEHRINDRNFKEYERHHTWTESGTTKRENARDEEMKESETSREGIQNAEWKGDVGAGPE